MQLSVVICTYNRSELLGRALESLSSQTADRGLFEVMVVDNNSTDNTQSVALDYCNQQPNWRYLFQPDQGLSSARNMGCDEAGGNYVGYLDDDSMASKEWIATALEIISTHKPDIFGGPSYPFYLSHKPAWFLDTYGSMDYGSEARQLTCREFLSGKNIVFRRELIYDLGQFDPKLGMTGSQLGFGEETALILKAFETVPDLSYYYDPRLYVTHLVAPYKMQLVSLARKSFADGRYQYRIFDSPSVIDQQTRSSNPEDQTTKVPRHEEDKTEGYSSCSSKSAFFVSLCLRGLFFPPRCEGLPANCRGRAGIAFAAMKLIFWILALPLDLLFAFFLRNKRRYRYPRNYIYEHSLRIVRQMGRTYEEIRVLRNRA